MQYCKNKHPRGIVVTMMFAILVGSLVFVSLNATLKDRVFFAVIAAFIMPLPFLLSGPFSRAQKYTILLSVFFLSCIINKQSSAIIKKQPDNARLYEDNDRLVNAYLSDQTKKLRFYAADFKSEYQNPFTISSNFHTGRIEKAGWLTNIPFNDGGFSSFEDYTDGYGLFVSKKSLPYAVSLLSKSILLNYQKKVEPHIVVESDDSVIIEFSLTTKQ